MRPPRTHKCFSIATTAWLQNKVCTLGLTLWNLSCLEFKFDDTRLSYYKKKIGRIEIFFCCFLTLLIFCPVGWLSFAYVSRKVWYHQIWIPNNLGFIVSDLMYILHSQQYILKILKILMIDPQEERFSRASIFSWSILKILKILKILMIDLQDQFLRLIIIVLDFYQMAFY